MPEVQTQETLSGRDLDALIAERVLGWTRYSKTVEASDNRAINGVLYCPPNFPDSNFGGLNSLPCYSSDIAAAMEVVEKMWQEGWQIELANGFKMKTPIADNVCSWWVRFINNENDMNNWSAEADTLPEAICRAALSASSQQQKETTP